MANRNLTPAQYALNAMLQRNFQALTPQQNMTGANGTGMAFLDGFQGGFNAGNAVVNAIRTAQDNARLRKDQAEYASILDGLKRKQEIEQNSGYSYNLGQIPQQQMAVEPQPNYTVKFGDLLGGNSNPFGDSANGEGQRVAEEGNVSPTAQYDYVTPVFSQAQQPQQTQQVQQRQMPSYEQNLDGRYSMQGYLQDMANKGVGGLNALLMYSAFAAPMEQAARQERIRNNIGIWENPESTDEQKTQAKIQLASDLGQLDLGFDLEQKRRKADLEEQRFMTQQGYMLNPDYDENVSDSIGNSIVSTALNNYKEGEQWMSPDGTGDSRTQCSNWVSDVLKRSGVKGLGHANGDELMKQAGKAYRTGLQGIQPGDVLNFKDHVGFYIGNGQYMARNSSGGVHRGSMEEAVKAFGEPLGYISMSQYTGNTRGQKYISNPNFVSDREKFNYRKQQDAWSRELGEKRLALAEQKIAAKNGGSTGNVAGLFDKNGKLTLPYDLDQPLDLAIEDLSKELVGLNKQAEENPDEKVTLNPNSFKNVVIPLKETYQYLVDNGVSESQAKQKIREMFKAKISKLNDKDAKNLYSEARMADILRDATSGESVESYKLGISSYRNRNDGSVIKDDKYLRGKENKAKEFANNVERKKQSDASFKNYFEKNLLKTGRKPDQNEFDIIKQQVMLDPRYNFR